MHSIGPNQEGDHAGRLVLVANAIQGKTTIHDSARERIAAVRNEHQLQGWFDQVFTAASVEDVFDEPDR